MAKGAVAMKNEHSGPLHSAAPSFGDPWSPEVTIGISRRLDTQSSVLQHNPKEVSKLMKKAMLVLLVVFAAAALAAAQVGTISQTTDILGPHLGYGRGCVMCHAPHSGPAGNNHATNDTQAGEFALWGQDLTPLYGQVVTFSGDGKNTYQVT